MINIFETHSLIVRGFFFVCFLLFLFVWVFIYFFFLNLIEFCKIIEPQKFKIKFEFVLHLTKKKLSRYADKKYIPCMCFSVSLHLHNIQIPECRSFSACLQIYHHPSHKISMETRPRKVSLNSWILFFYWMKKKVFEINSWTGYHLMNMSNITHDFIEIAARYSLRKRQEIDPTFPKFP